VVNFALSRLAVLVERSVGTRVRRNVAGSGGTGTPGPGQPVTTAAAPPTMV
jgi:hypothetical protein